MTVVLSLVTQVLHIGLMMITAPTVAGALAWLDGRLTGRSGPSVLAPWRDLVRLSRKTPMKLESVSPVAGLAPAVGLGAMLSTAALVPSFTTGMALAPLADVLVIVSLLAVAHIAATLAALDTGAALPGLAAQNASALAVLVEPALMLSVVTVALMAGSFNLDIIIVQQREGVLLPVTASALAAAGMLALLLADTDSGLQSDELDQMFGGTDLAVSLMTGWFRRLVWFDLIGSLFLPVGMADADSGPLGWLIGLGSWAAKLLALTAGLSAIATLLGRVPRHALPDLIGLAAVLALLAIIIVLAGAGIT